MITNDFELGKIENGHSQIFMCNGHWKWSRFCFQKFKKIVYHSIANYWTLDETRLRNLLKNHQNGNFETLLQFYIFRIIK